MPETSGLAVADGFASNCPALPGQRNGGGRIPKIAVKIMAGT
jgi:hypothetical protein